MSEIIVDTDLLSFLFKNHPMGNTMRRSWASSPVEASHGAT